MNEYRAAGMNPGRNMGDQVMYYRRPLYDQYGNKAENAGWITWGDTTSGTKARDYMIRGFELLRKYGVINTAANEKLADEEKIDANLRVWAPILRHPDGPGEFPLDQVLTLKWYRPEFCPIPGVVFPQLEGQKVREYRCPECTRPPFVDDIAGVGGIRALAGHLRIMHKWDRTNLMAYGDRIGVDFNKVDVTDVAVQEYSPDTTPKRRGKAQPSVPVEVI